MKTETRKLWHGTILPGVKNVRIEVNGDQVVIFADYPDGYHKRASSKDACTKDASPEPMLAQRAACQMQPAVAVQTVSQVFA